MLRVHRGHFSQRIDRDSLCCIDNIIKNAHIIEQLARPIVARRRGPREPLTLAALAALHNSLQELAVEEVKPRHHHVVSGADNFFFVELKALIDLVPPPACCHFWEQTLRLLKVHAWFDGFCWKQTDPGRRRRRSFGLPRCIVELIVTYLPSLYTPKRHCQSSSTLNLRFVS
jgi:hypothetical protein